MCDAMLHLHIGCHTCPHAASPLRSRIPTRPMPQAVPTAAAPASTHAQMHMRTPSRAHRQLMMPHATSTTCTPTGFHSTIHSPSGPPQDPTACCLRAIPQGCPHALAHATDANHDLHVSSLACQR
ncbi:hypothetical protein K439DRAFT_485405 [Ramaria rubella]|nr:hypothetical protein K439DRAFT_485405 [Ramaria rubella]